MKKLIKSIKKRLSGNYRTREIRHIDEAVPAIIEYLNNRPDPQVAEYLELYLPYLQRQSRVARLGRYVGSDAARIFYGYSKKEIRPPYEKELSPWLADGDDFYRFSTINIPIPIKKEEYVLYSMFFKDIILPYLLSDYKKSISQAFATESHYDYDDLCGLRKGDVVIDCGANIGFFSAYASARGCEVHAFEPSNFIIDNYLSKTAANNKNIRICQYALSDRSGIAAFSINMTNIGASFLSPFSTENSINEQVKLISLDEYVEANSLTSVDFIKADIEGAERHMLMGAKETLRKFGPRLAICSYHLPDDPMVLAELIREIRHDYVIRQGATILYAHIP